jgi:hypothetical protein
LPRAELLLPTGPASMPVLAAGGSGGGGGGFAGRGLIGLHAADASARQAARAAAVRMRPWYVSVP